MRIEKYPFAKTIAAKAGAILTYKQKSGRMIFMLKAGDDGICLLVGWVKIAPVVQFTDVGNYNPADWVIGVVPVYERKVIIVTFERKVTDDFFQLRFFSFANGEFVYFSYIAIFFHHFFEESLRVCSVCEYFFS